MPHDDTVLRAVHDGALLAHLETIHDEWVAARVPGVPGQRNVVPYVFPTAGMLDGLPVREPVRRRMRRAGLYCYDTMTLVGAGTWRAARAAVDAALTAADLVAGGGAGGVRDLPPARTPRDPGRVRRIVLPEQRGGGGRGVAGWPASSGSRWSTSTRTTATVRRRSSTTARDVFYGSVHVDPGAGWFPHYAGFADETGRGAGEGTNRNVPLAPGYRRRGWLAGLAEVCAAATAFGAGAVVVSLGVDAAADDPESPLAGHASTGTGAPAR